MASWSDVEVISIAGDSDEPDSESIDDPAEEQIFSQELQEAEDELLTEDSISDGETQVGHDLDFHPDYNPVNNEESQVETELEVLLSQPPAQEGGVKERTYALSPPKNGVQAAPSADNTAAGDGLIDLTGSLDPHEHDYHSPQTLADDSAPVLGFEEEYDELLECAVDDVSGAADFPFEAVAELLLRHPQHWWCRYTEAMSDMLLSVDRGSEGGYAASGAATAISLVWQEVDAQLGTCRRCLKVYHATKEKLRSGLLLDESDDMRPAEVERYISALRQRDSRRLQRAFASASEAADAAVALPTSHEIPGGAGSGSRGATVGVRRKAAPLALGPVATLAFWEVFSYAEILECGEVEEAFLTALRQITSCGAECFCGKGWEQHFPGVLTLLVHRDASTRQWAQFMVRRAGTIGAKVYRELLSPVINRWVPVLQQGLITTAPGGASSGGYASENEKLHWSGLHVALQLLDPCAAPLLTAGFPTLVDLTLQKIDEGPGIGVGVPLYLQVCGCLVALLRLLGSRLWDGSALRPQEVLAALVHQCNGGNNSSAIFGRSSSLSGSSNPAVRMKALEIMPLVVKSTPTSGDREERCPDGMGMGDTALKFLADELSRVSMVRVAGRGGGSGAAHRTALTKALLDIVEVCYDMSSRAAVIGPDSWPWNTATSIISQEEGAGAGRRWNSHATTTGADGSYERTWWPRSWPVCTFRYWGPRLADAAGDRKGHGSSPGGNGGSGSALKDHATVVVGLVLRRHTELVWKVALSALRGGLGQQGSTPPRLDLGNGSAQALEILPLCGPLLEKICLDIPVLQFPLGVHKAVFDAHGLISLLPCGQAALRPFGNGGAAAATLAKLHSGLLSQFLNLFVPYVKRLTEAVKARGPEVSPLKWVTVAPGMLQALLVPVSAARSSIEQLLSHSFPGTKDSGIRRAYSGTFETPGFDSLLHRLPRDCGRECFLAMPQALGAMAAAGPHLSVQSWARLFEAAAVLGCSVLLPSRQSGEGGGSGEGGVGDGRSARRGFAGWILPSEEDEEDKDLEKEDELWSVLEAIWEFAFLQVIPDALPALREEHPTRVEEACKGLFSSLESLWPLLTGTVANMRRPDLANTFLSSRALWLKSLLSWLTEPWLSQRAREAAAAFVQRALIPTLADTSPGAVLLLAGVADGYDRPAGRASPVKKVLGLVGGKLGAYDDDGDDVPGRDLSENEAEARMLKSLQSAAERVRNPTSTAATDAREMVKEIAPPVSTKALPTYSTEATVGAPVSKMKPMRQVYARDSSSTSRSESSPKKPARKPASTDDGYEDPSTAWIKRAYGRDDGRSTEASSTPVVPATSPYFGVSAKLSGVATDVSSSPTGGTVKSPYFAGAADDGSDSDTDCPAQDDMPGDLYETTWDEGPDMNIPEPERLEPKQLEPEKPAPERPEPEKPEPERPEPVRSEPERPEPERPEPKKPEPERPEPEMPEPESHRQEAGPKERKRQRRRREVAAEAPWIKKSTSGGRVTAVSNETGKRRAVRPKKPGKSSRTSDGENSGGAKRRNAAQAATKRAAADTSKASSDVSVSSSTVEGETRVVTKRITAAEAAANRKAEAAALAARKSAAAATSTALSTRVNGEALKSWKEMQRKQRAGGQEISGRLAPTSTSATSASGTVVAAAAASAAKESFAAAAAATARRAGTDVAAGKPPPIESVPAKTLDPATLAKEGATNLHRLVLSSWTVSELFAAESGAGARQGQGGQRDGRGTAGRRATDAEEGEVLAGVTESRYWNARQDGGGLAGDRAILGGARNDDEASLASGLWLSKVPRRFQSIEQYRDIFRALLLEEVFATLVAGLNGGNGNSGRRKDIGGRKAPTGPVRLRVTSFEEGAEAGFSHVSMVAEDDRGDGRGGGGRGNLGASCGYYNEDVLLLSLVDEHGNVDGSSSGMDTPACLGIFEKDPRGVGSRGAGNAGQRPPSIRVKVFFPSTDDGRKKDGIGEGVLPKKNTVPRRGGGGERVLGLGPAARILEAFRDAEGSAHGCLVRVVRLEGLNTCTREFVALEGISSVCLKDHILQATSEPMLEPLPQPPPRSQQSQSARPLRPVLGPAYPVDEASFVDACKRLAAAEGLCRSCSDRDGDGKGATTSLVFLGASSGDRQGRGGMLTASMDVLLRAIQSLASFRVTPSLLHSFGRSTAKRLQKLSAKPEKTPRSPRWSPEVRTAAGRLLKCWRFVANENSDNSSMSITDSIGSPAVERTPGKSTIQKDSPGGSELKRKGGDGKRAGSRSSARKENRDEQKKDRGMRSPVPMSPTSPSPAPPPLPPPEKPHLVPLPLWQRLSKEFNPSQLRAVWAAAATARETALERERERERDRVCGRERAEGPTLTPSKNPDASPSAERKASRNTSTGGGGSGVKRLGGVGEFTRAGMADGGVVLLQGPPGTGKTRTVLGVVSVILGREKEKASGLGAGVVTGDGGSGGRGMTLEVSSRQKRPGGAARLAAAKMHQRVLVCAPSNGAVDELTQRLADPVGGVWDQRGKHVAPRVLRVGTPSSGAAARVIPVTLNVQVEERVKLHPKSILLKDANAALDKAYSSIDQHNRELRETGGDRCPPERRHLLMGMIRSLRKEILKAKSVRQDSVRALEGERTRVRRSLLNNAQVVCATLSGCGSAHLVEAVASSRKGFDTVVVDEACQATELSTLIPLALGCKRLILVGDPRQLPATVISQKAAKLNMEISLFERLERAGYPVNMLTVQYRMHPEIRAFPSEWFYGGRLTDAPSVTQIQETDDALASPSRVKSVPKPIPLGPCFPPFLLVDVSTGQESRSRDSYENFTESSFVADMLDRLVSANFQRQRSSANPESSKAAAVKVGVISPYKAQVDRIKQDLSRRRLFNEDGSAIGNVHVEVCTVDGFQGREVDVVLFSCVRATPAGGGGGRGTIGFLSDRRRMNVAITRAKRSLVILGNVKRLASDRTWRALVEHANSYGKLVPGGDRSAGKTPSGEALCSRLEAMDKAHSEAVAAASADNGRAGGGRHEKEKRGKERRVDRSPGECEPRRKKIISATQQDERISSPTLRKDSNTPCGVQVEKLTEDSTSARALARSAKGGGEGKTRKARDGARTDKSDTLSGSSESSSRIVSSGEVAGDELAHAAPQDGKVPSKSRRGQDVNSDRSGGMDRPKKRTRKDRGSDNDTANDRNASKGGGGGFNLGGLLGSIDSTAKKIASGKDHEYRRGLQGGAEEERKRAAKAPRLNGAKVTELGRANEAKAPPPAVFSPPSTSSRRENQPSGDFTGERKVTSGTGSASASKAHDSTQRHALALESTRLPSSSKKVKSSQGGSSSEGAADKRRDLRRADNPSTRSSSSRQQVLPSTRSSNTVRHPVSKERERSGSSSKNGDAARHSTMPERHSAHVSRAPKSYSSSSGKSLRKFGCTSDVGGDGVVAMDGHAMHSSSPAGASTFNKTPKRANAAGGGNVGAVSNHRGGLNNHQQRDPHAVDRSTGVSARNAPRVPGDRAARRPSQGINRDQSSRAGVGTSTTLQSRITPRAGMNPGNGGGRSARVAAKKKKSSSSGGGGLDLLGSIMKGIDDTHTKK